jgi:hypothetical protein
MRERIIQEIQRLAKEHGQAPGLQVFIKETGIRKSEWYGKLWARWGDALLEAGFAPNSFQAKTETDFVLQKLAVACRHFGHLPTEGELRMFGQSDETFPSHSTFTNHFASKVERHVALKQWVASHLEFSDLQGMLEDAEPAQPVPKPRTNEDGYVYLLRSGPNFKIGRGQDLERRVKQVSVSLPDKLELVHAIKTDDPAGIELYWHRRFQDKRLNGEWFKLTPPDVLAFKRRKFQ